MVRLGEISRSQTSVAATDIPAPADIVAAKAAALLPEVGAKLIVEASRSLLEGGVDMEAEVAFRLMPCGLHAAEIRLPEEFLALTSLKMSGWERSVSRLVLPDEADWDCQWSEEPGIAGCQARPRVYLDGNVLRAIGDGADAAIEWLRGWKIPSPGSDGKFHFPASLYPALVGGIINIF
ncbi:MAG: hypothetical protein K2K23_08895 [Muribaculaceae bacterium]|nr:hypothetical protein [Muribaculaceae bacterium]